MKQFPCLLACLLLMACTEPAEPFDVEVMLPYTPVKNQGASQMCWAYAMLSTIETEHICRGDSVHLSVAYVERMMEQAPGAPASKRGVGLTLVGLIQKYGLAPYESMRTVDVPAPRRVFMLGAEYTPQEFARSVCAPGEYVGFATTTRRPYGQPFELDLPDNWDHNTVWNLPGDSLVALVELAIRHRHGVCWEGDISEGGFQWKQGVARLQLLSGRTTDDHCMAIVGLARDRQGRPYFVMKNSWGTHNPYDGLLYMSFDYFRSKTLAVFMSREALPANSIVSL